MCTSLELAGGNKKLEKEMATMQHCKDVTLCVKQGIAVLTMRFTQILKDEVAKNNLNV